MQKDLGQAGAQASVPVSRHAATFIFITVALDAIGIGIILPVMPDLIRELADLSISGAALWGGYLSFVYALMQFALGPTVGNLSDRFGRRPVLLSSLFVLTIDYLIMGFAPSLWLLFIGRLLAGIAGATHSTANAFMADISSPEMRARNFGLLGAGFGLGFILGPVIGGIAGEFGTRIPFFAAALIAALNFIYGAIVLPETLKPENRRPFSPARANPLGVARQIAKFPVVAWLFLVSFFFNIAHFVYPAVWSYFTKEAFAWSNAEVGLSLAFVGVGFAVVQGILMGPMIKNMGEKNTVILGFVVSVLGLIGMAFATAGWMIYALMPLTVLGAIITPALTSVMSTRIPDDAQGELQGALTSISGITLIISPLFMTQLFGAFSRPDAAIYFPGAPFLAAAFLMLLALAVFYFAHNANNEREKAGLFFRRIALPDILLGSTYNAVNDIAHAGIFAKGFSGQLQSRAFCDLSQLGLGAQARQASSEQGRAVIAQNIDRVIVAGVKPLDCLLCCRCAGNDGLGIDAHQPPCEGFVTLRLLGNHVEQCRDNFVGRNFPIWRFH